MPQSHSGRRQGHEGGPCLLRHGAHVRLSQTPLPAGLSPRLRSRTRLLHPPMISGLIFQVLLTLFKPAGFGGSGAGTPGCCCC